MQLLNPSSDSAEIVGTLPDVSFLVDDSNERVRTALLESLLGMPYDDFEALVGQLLVGVGYKNYKNVQVTVRGPDGGVDLTAEAPVMLDTVRVLVQVKRRKRNSPVEVIRALCQVTPENVPPINGHDVPVIVNPFGY